MPRRTPPLLAALVLALVTTGLGVGVGATPAAASSDYNQVVDITFPTDPAVTYIDDFRYGRSRGEHGATDLMGEQMMPIHAARGGTITWITGIDGPMPRYGYMITIAGDDGRDYSYLHLNNDTPGTDDGRGGPENAYAEGLRRGSRVERGQFLGWMGDSGNAEHTRHHLHFEIADDRVTDPQGTHRINPFHSLNAARDRGDYPGAWAPAPPEPEPERATVSPAESACPIAEVPDAGFADVTPGGTHQVGIDCAAWWELAEGITEDRFAPHQGVTRGQMASFLWRLTLETPTKQSADATNHFPDDDGTTHEEAIDALAALGVVEGSTEGLYGPDETVTRAQMATLLVRGYETITGETLVAGDDAFADDDASVHRANIDKGHAAGFVSGYPDDTFRPGDPVTRAQMTTFLARALDVLVERGQASTP